MGLSNKNFDELDDLCEFDEKPEVLEDGEPQDPALGSALSWRRFLIERSADNVKRVQGLPSDLQASYKKGELVFDKDSNKFGRVIESRPGLLNMSMIDGTNVLRQDIDPLEFVKKNRKALTSPEMAVRIMRTEMEIIAFLNP